MTLLTNLPFRATDSSGEIIPAARLQFYETGTTTPVEIFTDAAFQVPASNPVISDAGGLFAPIYLKGGNYRVELQAQSGAILQVADPVAITPDPQAANDVLASLQGLLPFVSDFTALSNSIDSFTNPALLQQFVNNFAAANNALGAGGLQSLGSRVARLEQGVARLDTFHPPIPPFIERFPVLFDVEEGFVGLVYDFEPDVSDPDSPRSNLSTSIRPDTGGQVLASGFEIVDKFQLMADGSQPVGTGRHVFRVRDESDNLVQRPFDLTVRPAGSPPIIMPRFGTIPNETVVSGFPIPARNHFSDIVNNAQLPQPVTITTSVSPSSGVSFSNGTRGGTAGTAGSYTVRITATDAAGQVGITEYNVTVTAATAPVWQPLPPVTAQRGTGNAVINLAPLVSAGVTIDEPIMGAPPGTSVNGLQVSIPTGSALQPSEFYFLQFSARNPSGQTSLSGTQTVTIIGNTPFL